MRKNFIKMYREAYQLEKKRVWEREITFKAAQQLGEQQPVKTLNVHSHSVAGKPTSHKIDLTFWSLLETFNACMFISLCLYYSPMGLSGFSQPSAGGECLKLLRVYNVFAPLTMTTFTDAHKLPLPVWVSEPGVWLRAASLASVFVTSRWFVVPYFGKSLLKISSWIHLLFSRSLSFLNPDLPVVWQTKLSVRIVQFFPISLVMS